MTASNNVSNTVTTNILPVQALYDPTTLAFITFIGPAGLPFTSAAGGVSSVDVSGGTTGLTTTGGPIVSSGTITLGGTLAVTNGGTGATTATGAINNLLPSQATHAGKYLTTDGTNTSWSTSGANLSVVNDTSTNATRYLTFTDVNTGVITQEYVSSSKLTYNPSSGTVTATTFVGALTGNASTATLAASSTNIAGGANGSLPYQTGSGTTTFLAAGSNGQFLTLSGGVPTWSSLSYVSSFSAGTTGFTPNVSTTGAVTLSGTLNVANGGTGVTSSSGTNSVVLRDANANTSANDFYEGFTNVAAAGTTITLTAASTPNFVITGSGGQTYKLPDATTIPTGAIYTFNNNQTSGAISVQNSSGTLVVSVPSGGFVEIILLTNSVAAGTWDYHFQAPSNVSWSTNTFSYSGSITNATWNATAIGAIYGGTGQTSYTTGDTLYASASNTLSKLAIGSTGQVLTVSGGVPIWSSPASGASITDDTSTNGTRYINFTSATSGSLSTIYTSSTKLQYNPSTGILTTTGFSGSGASLTSLNASNISSGTIGSSYVSGSYTSITGVGTLTAGTWNASVIGGTYGGTGVNNGSNTITIAGNVTHSGAFTQTFVATGNTSVTLPTSGTLLTTTGSGSSLTFGTGSLSLGGNLTFSGAFATTFTTTATTSLTLPTSGTVTALGNTTTGSGSIVLATSPTLVTPVLGTPTSGNLSNCTADGTNAVGFLNIPINSQSAAYTLVLSDAGKAILHPSTDANARTFTIPANSSVAYPVGTAISFINMTSQVVSIAITTDTMYLSSAGTTGTRSLAQYGTATAVKMTSTTWIISGSGLT